MPNLVSSKKDLRRTVRRSAFNDRIRARVKKAVKNFTTFISAKNVEKAQESLKQATKVIDKASQKNIFKKDTSSRKISRLNIKLNKLIAAQNVEATKESA